MASRAVALLIETSNAYARGLLEGVVQYIRAHHPWSVYLPEQNRGADVPAWISTWNGDGIIARIETEEIARTLRKTKVPVVDVSAARLIPELPWVETDDAEIARMAAGHLLDRGFQQLAFCGDSRFNWSLWRQSHFEKIVLGAGIPCHIHNPSHPHTGPEKWNLEKQELADWLQTLPRPIGIFACYDIKAQQLLDLCREQEISVPEEIAVLGVDDDRLLCDLASPPLSSVVPNAHRTGYLAAELLERMMNGESISSSAHLVKPIGIQTRQSTDILAISDPYVASALRYLREHACEGVKVNTLLKSIPLSRRALEGRFRKLLGRTPHEEAMRLRIDRVRQLLTETDLSLAQIARLSGFTHVEYLSVVFKREVGQTPRQYRKDA